MNTTKWVAGFNDSGDVVVAQCKCYEAKHKVVLEHRIIEGFQTPPEGEGWEALQITGFRTHFSRDDAAKIFHDTVEEALEALHRRELDTILEARRTISKAQDRMNQIDNFEAQA